ncbi:MAG TPA: hypothetical protein VHP82_02995, partial [Gaiellaceae bacterium]|nr:hypothetical protein [Gaiellaceae bacterium]
MPKRLHRRRKQSASANRWYQSCGLDKLGVTGSRDPDRQAALDNQIERLNMVRPNDPPLPFPWSAQLEGELRELRCQCSTAAPATCSSCLPLRRAVRSAIREFDEPRGSVSRHEDALEALTAADGWLRVGCGVGGRPARGNGEALREAFGVSELRKVTASRPGVDFDLRERFAQPLLVDGLERVAGDDEVG